MPEKVLIVDDEKEIADLVTLYLKNKNFEVFTFYDGISALKCIEEEIQGDHYTGQFHISDAVNVYNEIEKNISDNTSYSETETQTMTGETLGCIESTATTGACVKKG